MLTKRQISEIVKAGIHDVLPAAKIANVKVNEDTDAFDERPTLAIIVVFSKPPTLGGEDFFSLHEAVQKRLTDSGETRYPFLRYVGEKELRSAVS